MNTFFVVCIALVSIATASASSIPRDNDFEIMPACAMGDDFKETRAELNMIVNGKFGIEKFSLEPQEESDKTVAPGQEVLYRNVHLKTPLMEITGMSLEVHSETPINFEECSLFDAKLLHSDVPDEERIKDFCYKGTDGKNVAFELC